MVEKHVRKQFLITQQQDRWLSKEYPQGASKLIRRLLEKLMH